MALPSYLTIRQVELKPGPIPTKTWILCAAQDIPHKRMVGPAFITHPHIGIGKKPGPGKEGSIITTPLGEFLTESDDPNGKLWDVMLSGGWDWGLRYEDCWCRCLDIIRPMKKGEPLTVQLGELGDIERTD